MASFLQTADRRLGRDIRAILARHRQVDRAVRSAGGALGPLFTTLVAALILRPRTRRAGLRAGVSATSAAWSARLLRDLIRRPRPGDRTDSGFPSRHAASAVAIVCAVGREDPAVRRVLGAVAAVGLLGRVARAEHDPADIAAGALLGVGAETLVGRLVDR